MAAAPRTVTLLLDPSLLDARRAAAAGPLAPLLRSLAAELEPLVGREPWLPAEKARLTRSGGRCVRDGVLLAFDPWSPRQHTCPRCGAVYTGEEHYRWWIMGYQLWLAERAVHAALLYLLGGDARHGALADEILYACAARYLTYPNADNVLGPTRPFFSTYLESIWMLQLCVAADLRRAAGADAIADRVVERVIAPSAALVAEYDEGLSNRQTWNAAALLAAARLLDDEALADRCVSGESGVVAHLRYGLLADGSWYEGENYHLFAHRALWYGVTLAERSGAALPADLLARFAEGFATPFATALPDFTFPARRDSQWKVSLRQWRFAESCELGLARGDDPRLVAALRTLYDPAAAPGRTGRAESTAETERNHPAARLTRASLGWKSLLAAPAALRDVAAYVPPPGSVLLPSQGLGILRREGGRVYVALDYGHSGGGHGHPDRLNLLLHDGDVRWLDDYGTGSYTERALHWYRSTLAHDAPLVDGRSQARVDGRLVAWEDRGGAGWIEAEVDDVAPGVTMRRTVVAMPDYLVDVVAWRAHDVVMVDVPLHADGELRDVEAWCAGDLAGGDADTDGFAFLEDAEVTYAAGDMPVRLEATLGEHAATAWLLPDYPAEWWRARAPGAPGEGSRRFHLTRGQGQQGSLVTVWSWRGSVTSARIEGDDAIVELRGGDRHAHRRTAEGWHVDLLAGGARSSIDLAGIRPGAEPELPEPEPARAPLHVAHRAHAPAPHVALLARAPEPLPALGEPLGADATVARLGRADYRRSEQTWYEAGEPRATLELAHGPHGVVLQVVAHAGSPYFAPAAEDNPLDNEHPDVNSTGLQLYVRLLARGGAVRWHAAWLVVPEPERGGGRVALREAHGTPPQPLVESAAGDGRWATRVTLPEASLADGMLLAVHVVVNEMPLGRERRRGQLVLGGAPDEWTYLRGDRESMGRALLFRLS